MNQTWLPSHTGPTVFTMMRRSMSFFATKGSRAAVPRSNPSMIAKPASRTPSSAHQMRRRISYSVMVSLHGQFGRMRRRQRFVRPEPRIFDEQIEIDDEQYGIEKRKAQEAEE